MDDTTAPSETPNSAAERTRDPVERPYRVEARNQQSDAGRGAFDFAIESVNGRSAPCAPLNVLAGVVGAAGYAHASELGLDVAVERVVVESDRAPVRADGGDRSDDDGPLERVARVVVEVGSSEQARSLTRWRDRLLADARALRMGPPVDSILLLVTADTGRGDGADQSSIAD